MQDSAIPILPSRDLVETGRFYEVLGFSWTVYEEHGYLIIQRGSLELHFFAMPECDPHTSYSGAFLRVADVDALHRAFTAAPLPSAGIPRLTAPENKPWGVRECALVDPSGNLLRIGSDL